ncbi:MAG: S-adenosylmethionine:tRNA ribosyltransferase-isomerase [Bacteroidaceae bacterium]|nr:S-adenosylmethionine:tRNA ribosyltransferase-isomerase [Bacteroidaceae bacterium]
MTSTKDIRIADYSYELPDHRIAKFPLAERDASKLLIYNKGVVTEDTFRNLPQYLPKGALMVFNNTKVIQARLHFQKETGATIEVFCMEPFAPAEYQQNFAQTGSVEWLCMIGNLKRWKEGRLSKTIEVSPSSNSPRGGREQILLTAERLPYESKSGMVRVRFSWVRSPSPNLPRGGGDSRSSHLSPSGEMSAGQRGASLAFSEILEAVGELPIPPYLNRETQESDKRTYQTVYSKIKGSVAAPTAGLHFTERVLADIDAAGIDREELTLHVGAGTFKPVKSEDIGHHEMHSEYIVVRRQTIEKLIEHGGHAIAVGTTSVRTLESLYYIGLKILRNPDITEEELHVGQWEPYTDPPPAPLTVRAGSGYSADGSSNNNSNHSTPLPRREGNEGGSVLQAILSWLDRNNLSALHTTTQIIIAPGYEYKIVRCMVTNFHQPQSTLLLLVSAFVHGDWRRIYDYALAHDFRFLSYGDSSLLIP